MAGGKKCQSPPASSDIDLLMQRKSKAVENIARIKRSIIEKTVSTNGFEIECRLEILNDHITQAKELQSQIESLDPNNDDRSELEDLCVATKALLLGLQAKHKRTSEAETSFLGFNSSISRHSRLPNMRLPKFSGIYSEYKNFMSLFENLIHNDPTLSDIEKFNHLISCLSDEALGTVKAFQVTENNYPKALASLKKVYDNDCLIFMDNISKLFDLPEITKPSASALRSMIDTVSAIYDSLLSIGDDKKIANAVLIYLVMSKVDPVTKSKWEEQLDFEKLPLWSDCEAALNKRYQHISADESSSSRPTSSKNKSDNAHKRISRTSLSCTKFKPKQSAEKCLCCSNQQHSVHSCPSFAAWPVLKRFDFIKAVPACINCLKKGHTVARCSAQKCSVCSGAHNKLLHRYSSDSQSASATQNSSINYLSEQPSASYASVNYSSSSENVLLATAVVKVRSSSGSYILARALLDSGSQPNLITEDLAQRLRIKREGGRLNLNGIGETVSSAKSSVKISVMSRVNSAQFSSKFWVLKSITSFKPDSRICTNDWSIPKNIELADPCFYKPQKVDLLIGGELFYELLCVGQIKSNPSLPVLQKTSLGWIVAGKYNQSKGSSLNVCHVSNVIEDEETVDSIVRKFWEMEELKTESTVIHNEEQRKCEESFKESVRRIPSGRFEVSLPFKSDPSSLGLSFDNAKRRFLALERKLSKDEVMRGMYHDFMKEYADLGHMSIVDDIDPSLPHYFIPHQCVLRPLSTTTKLRVVFDASSRTSSHTSLNDLLMVGPTVQEELYSTLIRFRFHKFVITADIEKMYRQVLVSEKDRNFQLILWRQNPTDPLQVFRLNTVTYGTASAPFLAIRCLTHLSDLYKETLPIGANVIRSDFYVDDLLTGADSFQELLTIREQVTQILSSAGFNLTKWFSNHPDFNVSERNEKLLHNESDSAKALGIHWVPKNDSFEFHLEDNFSDLKATKRNILSVSSRLFDPLGLLCPIITKSKMLLQELWLQKLDWDESIPMRLNTAWDEFKRNLLNIDSVQIPRFVHTSSGSVIQIHGFSDASIRAYGCCIYIRSSDSNGVSCRLLTAKSKVAPLKTKSLPRLELCAAHLLANLWSRIKKMISFEIESVNFWTDSEITLHWIKTHSSTLATFVSNRVAEIQELSDRVSWRHVPTKQNPADIVSRGCDVEELKKSIWFEGPSFLLRDSTKWPVNHHFELTEDQESLEKRKSNVLLAVENSTELESSPKADSGNVFLKLIEDHSSYKKIIRIMCFVLRFVDFCRQYKISKSETPTAKERSWAFYRLVEIVQRENFAVEISKLKKSLVLPSNIQRLTPFIHNFTENKRNFSLVRVGGRLLNAPLSFNTKFPLLLPRKTEFVTRYLRDLHFNNCHAGTKALISLLRENIWLINARDECSNIVRKCVHCYRYKPKLMTQIMGNLPTDRVRALRPFLIVGVDFCGPVHISLRIRGKQPIKMYIAVYVCFTSKAVHLELVSDLSTDTFILSFKRFVARRGLPSKVYCDNATNFVGASRTLKELYEAFERGKKDVVSYAASFKVDFNFIPPRAPHFGGLWEAAVKQAKHLLLRAVGNASLTQEEMVTLLAEVEAVLNSRPIAPLSPDPNDGDALTPAHLLLGEGLRSLPPGSAEDVNDAKLRCLKRWRMLCALKQRFWRAWSKDYILGLQNKGKWLKEEPNLSVDQLVVVHEDNLPPQEWLTGRVVRVIEGQDGKVRVAEVVTRNGVYKRPVHKLAPLPVV